MASILNSLAFKNFYNYYGDFEDNHYELLDGINIIVADNGAGKSKFFNAFLWMFNDQVLDSDVKGRGDSGIRNVKDNCVKILSDKAKLETPLRNSVDCAIRIEYTHGTRYRYQIIKSFTATRLSENITDGNSWQFIINDVEVYRTELVLTKFKPIYDEDEKRRIIDNLIMPAFRKYSFLQGEEVDDIIDFGKKSSIEEAVQNLTDIKKYDKIVELTEYFKERAWRDLNNQNRENDNQTKLLDSAIEERNNLKLRLDQETAKLNEWQATFEDAEKEKNNLDKLYSNAERRKELDDKIQSTEKKLKTIKQEYEDFIDRINNKFFDGNFSWIAMGFDDSIDAYRSLKEKFTEKRYRKKAQIEAEDSPNSFFHFLPVNSPDTVSLQNMIEKEHCYVCNRPAKYGSTEHNHLIKLMNRPRDSNSRTSFVKNDLNNFFGNLQINAQPFYSRIPTIQESIQKTRLKDRELQELISKIEEQLKSLRAQRKDIFLAGIDSAASPGNIIADYKGAFKRMENARAHIDNILIPKINRLKNDIRNTETEIAKLNDVQDIPNGFKDNYSVMNDLAQASEKARDRVFDKMINLLEEHANKHFKNLIANNDLQGGNLKFEKNPSGSINFNYIDSKGNSVYGSSEGFQRMKKFAVVMAIISANNSKYNYPLLADAPISAFGKGFTQGFFKATGEIFPQSIVLVKELYDSSDELLINDLGKSLLRDNNVKTFYVNSVPKDAEQIQIFTTNRRLK